MRIPFKAWYYESTIDEKKIRELCADYTIEFDDPLVIKLGSDHRAMITGFGAVVFWPYDEQIARQVGSKISTILTDPRVLEEVEDRLVVETDQKEDKILYDGVWLSGEASPTHMRIIAMLLAQSVALDYLERQAENALQAFAPYLEDLQTKGRIRISGTTILKRIGFAMQTRFTVLTNLALFDKPSETWESEGIMKLYRGLYDLFDIPERQEVMNAKLDFISENTRMLFEVLSSRKSHYLEWIVIILIASEILAFGIFELLRT